MLSALPQLGTWERYKARLGLNSVVVPLFHKMLLHNRMTYYCDMKMPSDVFVMPKKWMNNAHISQKSTFSCLFKFKNAFV